MILEEKEDEEAEEILDQCDDVFYENEEQINRILQEYANTLEIWLLSDRNLSFQALFIRVIKFKTPKETRYTIWCGEFLLVTGKFASINGFWVMSTTSVARWVSEEKKVPVARFPSFPL